MNLFFFFNSLSFRFSVASCLCISIFPCQTPSLSLRLSISYTFSIVSSRLTLYLPLNNGRLLFIIHFVKTLFNTSLPSDLLTTCILNVPIVYISRMWKCRIFYLSNTVQPLWLCSLSSSLYTGPNIMFFFTACFLISSFVVDWVSKAQVACIGLE